MSHHYTVASAALLLCIASVQGFANGNDASLAVPRGPERLVQIEAAWQPLDGDRSPDSAYYLSAPSLAADPLTNPVLAFSISDPVTFRTQTYLSRWLRGEWLALGQPFEDGFGASVAVDSRRRIVLCAGDGPYV